MLFICAHCVCLTFNDVVQFYVIPMNMMSIFNVIIQNIVLDVCMCVTLNWSGRVF